MKKFLNIILALACVFALAFAFTACSSTVECVSHSDINKDGYCDICVTPYSCPGHKDVNSDKICDFCLADYSHSDHYDDDGDLKCDICGAPHICEHEDADADEFCDICLGEFICPGHTDINRDEFCDRCKAFFICPGHIDSDGDKICDRCQSFYSCKSHKDAEGDGKCDICNAPFVCEEHIDPGADGRCDKCYGVFVCSGHSDDNGDGKCDLCQTKYEASKDLRYGFVTASKATAPGSMVVTVSTEYAGIATLTSVYTVTFNDDGSFVIVAEIQEINDALEGDTVVTRPAVTITRTEDGNYSDGYEFEYLQPSVSKPVIDFMKLKAGAFKTPNSTLLEATVAAADTASVFGTAYPYDVTLTVNKNDTALTSISISYSNVVITCVYN